MADPLSIAGSVVGITAAGVQASIRLYAIAEKVVTASQRVRSIADDISSTCAILNQVRELIIPQPDAQGTLKSVFNSIALGDISHALRRCRAVFTETEALLSNAFEQVRTRSTPHSKIELSKFEKAKWPFLQPQFDDLRNDLRGAKGDLVLMIAVASLALAQRNGRQRPVHDRERLELGSTIVQLQRARTIKPQDRSTAETSQNQRRSLRKLFGMRKNDDTDEHMMLERNRGMDSTRVSVSGSLKPTTASPRELRQDARSSTLINDWAHGVPPNDVNISPEDTSSPSTAGGTILATLASTSRPLELMRRNVPVAPDSLRELDSEEPDPRDQNSLPATAASPSPFVPTAMTQPAQEQPEATVTSSTLAATPSIASASNETRYYQGWVTNYLEGLSTGQGDSLSPDLMKLPDRSLEKLVKIYTEEGRDPHIAISELTKQQQWLIQHSCSKRPDAEVAYVNVQHNITVPSVFGLLKIDTLKWIVVSRSRLPPIDFHGYETAWRPKNEPIDSPSKVPFSIRYSSRRNELDHGYIAHGPSSPAPPLRAYTIDHDTEEKEDDLSRWLLSRNGLPQTNAPSSSDRLPSTDVLPGWMRSPKPYEVPMQHGGGCAYDPTLTYGCMQEEQQVSPPSPTNPTTPTTSTYLAQTRRPSGSGSRPATRDGQRPISNEMVIKIGQRPRHPRVAPNDSSGNLPYVPTVTSILPAPGVDRPRRVPSRFHQNRPSTSWLSPFRRNRNNALPPVPSTEPVLYAENKDDKEDEEDEIVNELLARWTTS